MLRFSIRLWALGVFLINAVAFGQTNDEARTTRREAERLLRERDLEGAIAAFTRSLEADPGQADVQLRRGDTYFRLRKINQAIADYTAVTETQEDHAAALIRRAYAWRLLRMHHKALDDFQTVLTIHPDHPPALEARASLLYERGDYGGSLRDAKRLVLYDEDWAGANLRAANASFARQDYRSAVQAYDRVLLMSPDHASAWYWSAVSLIALGSDDAAAERIANLIHMNPDQGGGYARQSPMSREPTPDDLEHGRKQVEQMLQDRPEMARHVTLDDEIVAWTVRKFAGEDVPGRIIWDRSSPGDAGADHRGPRNGRSARVRVGNSLPSAIGAPGRPFGFDEQWSMLAYELHNVQSYQRFYEIADLARDGYLTRDGFVREYARLEFHALQRTRAWYLDCYRPWAKKRGIESNDRTWRIHLSLTFDEFMDDYQDKSQYPWVPYLSYYDRLQQSKLPVSGPNE